jgi:hypothetical protein
MNGLEALDPLARMTIGVVQGFIGVHRRLSADSKNFVRITPHD